MLFNSLEFIGFLIITFTIYYLPVFKKCQIYILIVASFIFYAFNNPALLLLLLASICVNAIASYKTVYSDNKNKKAWATGGVVVNLLILIFFKYSPLIARTFFTPDSSTSSVYYFFISIPLPIGISFFTFQGISLMVDTFKEDKAKNDVSRLVESDFMTHSKNIALFKSFFPQLIAGPIVKAHEFIYQIGLKELKNINWNEAYKNLVLGYFLKVVVADNLKEHTAFMIHPHFLNLPTASLITLLFGYSIEIFSDFAGYSLIALGLAGLFGYRLPQNFNYPYISSSFSEFWKRWHISLSTWLREYLYIPLGGNRKSTLRTYINLMLVMFLGGLWHGAAWSYAVWGTFHGLLLCTERLLNGTIRIKKNPALTAIKILFVFSCVSLAWLLFRLPDFSQAVLYVQSMFKNIHEDFRFTEFNMYIFLYSLPVIFYYIIYLSPQHLKEKYIMPNQAYIFAVMLFLIITNAGFEQRFIYFQF